MDKQLAWSTLTLKSADDEQRIITGIASTPSTDRVGDIVEPKGAQFKLPIPLLSQHDHASPIGDVTEAKVTDAGIEIVGKIAKNTGLDYVETAWKQLKSRLVRGLSIGFRPLDVEPLKEGGYRFKQWEWFELSAVTIPAQAEATIAMVKSLDRQSIKDAIAEKGKPSVEDPAKLALQEALDILSNKR